MIPLDEDVNLSLSAYLPASIEFVFLRGCEQWVTGRKIKLRELAALVPGCKMNGLSKLRKILFLTPNGIDNFFFYAPREAYRLLRSECQDGGFQLTIEASKRLETKADNVMPPTDVNDLRDDVFDNEMQNNRDITLKTKEGASGERYCICGGPFNGKMLACDNNFCNVEWFHYDCVKLISEADEAWFCPECSMTAATVAARASDDRSMVDEVEQGYRLQYSSPSEEVRSGLE